MSFYWLHLGTFLGMKRLVNRRCVVLRLLLVLILTVIGSCGVYQFIGADAIPKFQIPVWNFFLFVYCYQLIGLLVSWLTQSVGNTQLVYIAHCLPITRWRLRFVAQIPHAVSLFLLVVGGLPLAIPIGRQLGLTMSQILIAALLGSASGFGIEQCLATANSSFRHVLWLLVSGATFYLEHWCLQNLSQISHLHTLDIWCLVLLIVFWIFQAYWQIRQGVFDRRQAIRLQWWRKYIPHFLWSAKVAIGNRYTQISILTAGALGISSASFIFTKHGPPGLIVSCLSLFAAATSADFRSLSRPKNPAGIAALDGTYSYIKHQFYAASWCVFLLFTPVLAYMSRITPARVLPAICEIAAGVAIGLLVGHSFVRLQRTVWPPIVVTIIGTSLLFVLPTQLRLDVKPVWLQSGLYLTLGTLCLLLTFLVEYHRNRYIWRQPSR